MADDKWNKGYKGWLKNIILPLAIALITGLITVSAAHNLYFKPDRLPIQPNPSTNITGAWNVQYWATKEYEPKLPLDQFPALKGWPAEKPGIASEANLDVDQKDAGFTGMAMSGNQAWVLEGYVDGDSILYVYKDKYNANSFGSALIRRAGHAKEYVGVWSGVSPEFNRQGSGTKAKPFIVFGYVRWTRQ